MILLTPRAAAQVRTLRSNSETPDAPLRLLVENGSCSGMQCGMSFEAAKADDVIFESEGISIVVDPKSVPFLSGCSVDFDDGLHGKGFEIKNPNAKSTCGCGKSFN